MKRIRLSTLMLLIVIAALVAALVSRERHAARRIAQLEAERAEVAASALRRAHFMRQASEQFFSDAKATLDRSAE